MVGRVTTCSGPIKSGQLCERSVLGRYSILPATVERARHWREGDRGASAEFKSSEASAKLRPVPSNALPRPRAS